ncbi:MAG: hypothetical protein WKF56_02945 [Candidatus Limnocylindrales bacterium]
MTDPSDSSEPMEQPERIQAPDGTRGDGRPTGQGDELIPGRPHEEVPTIAPEEEGSMPTTEHAPGSDL